MTSSMFTTWCFARRTEGALSVSSDSSEPERPSKRR